MEFKEKSSKIELIMKTIIMTSEGIPRTAVTTDGQNIEIINSYGLYGTTNVTHQGRQIS